MQIVIDIPEDLKKMIFDDEVFDIAHSYRLAMCVKNGTPLPKGHGRLIDANELCEDRVSNDTVVIVAKCARTIIEADKKYEAEVITRGNCMMCGKELTEGLFFCKECGDKANSGK